MLRASGNVPGRHCHDTRQSTRNEQLRPQVQGDRAGLPSCLHDLTCLRLLYGLQGRECGTQWVPRLLHKTDGGQHTGTGPCRSRTHWDCQHSLSTLRPVTTGLLVLRPSKGLGSLSH